MTNKMKAIVYYKYGSSDVLEYVRKNLFWSYQ